MATITGSPALPRVRNDTVWGLTRVVFIGSALLFLVNILLGFGNALTTGSLPRWQLLVHLHSGAIGWITLSLIGLAVWVFTGDREVSDGYVRAVRWLAWLAVIVFAGYLLGFGLAFSGVTGFVVLPGFGTAAMLVIWAAAVYAVTQLRSQPVVTTVHVLIAGGLLVAAVGATMGVALGFEYVVGPFLPIEVPDRVGVHAGMMDTYILLVASAIVEWAVLKDRAKRWTRSGLAQAMAGTVAAILVPIAFLTNTLDVLLPVFAVFLLVFLLLFLGRMGWRAFWVNPLRTGLDAWTFFGTLWLVVFVGLFLYGVVGLQGDFASAPIWYGALFAHSAFVGMMTNLLVGVYFVRTASASDRFPAGEPAALWLLNGGLVVFFALKIALDTRLGALVMGLGVLLAVLVLLVRLQASD